MIGTEDSLVFVSGHATNVTTIGHLFGKLDLIVHDALVHKVFSRDANSPKQRTFLFHTTTGKPWT